MTVAATLCLGKPGVITLLQHSWQGELTHFWSAVSITGGNSQLNSWGFLAESALSAVSSPPLCKGACSCHLHAEKTTCG